MKKMSVALIALSVLFAASGCSSAQKPSSRGMSTSDAAVGMMGASEKSAAIAATITASSADSKAIGAPAIAPVPQAGFVAQEERKVAYSASLTAETKDFQKTQAGIETLTESLGGYIVNSSMSFAGDENPYGSFSIRVPQDKLKTFEQKLADTGAVVKQRAISGSDVTSQYVDVQSRLRAKEAAAEQLQSFLKNAKTTEELLKVNAEIERNQSAIEQMKGQMKYLEGVTDYALATLQLRQTKIASPDLSKQELNTWALAKKALGENVAGLLAFFSGLFVLLFGSFPTLAILALIAYAVYRSIKKKRTKKSPKTEEPKAEEAKEDEK